MDKRISNLLNAIYNISKKVEKYKNHLSETVNLKLYSVATLDDLDAETFNEFCEYSFDSFTYSIMNIYGVDFSDLLRVGRTSSFYCFSKNEFDFYELSTGFIELGVAEDIVVSELLWDADEWIFNPTMICSDINTALRSYEKLKILRDRSDKNRIIDVIIEELESIKSQLIDYVIELSKYSSIKKMIEEFKESQIEYYEEYLKNIRDMEECMEDVGGIDE